MALSWLQRLLKKSRPLSRSARRHTLTLEALEDRTVPTFLPPATFPVGIAPRAVTVADFNHDGKPDLAVVNTGPFSTSVAGRFTIRAVYSGDATFDASEQSLTEQVNP